MPFQQICTITTCSGRLLDIFSVTSGQYQIQQVWSDSAQNSVKSAHGLTITWCSFQQKESIKQTEPMTKTSGQSIKYDQLTVNFVKIAAYLGGNKLNNNFT